MDWFALCRHCENYPPFSKVRGTKRGRSIDHIFSLSMKLNTAYIKAYSFPTNYQTDWNIDEDGIIMATKYWQRNDTATARFILSYLRPTPTNSDRNRSFVPPLIKSVKNSFENLRSISVGGSDKLAANFA